MKAKITSVADRGVPLKERVVIRALADIDVGQYAIFRSLLQDGQITNGITDVYWFGSKTVKAGDLVVVYSKMGTESERALTSGATAHFFYWERSGVLWETDAHVPVLVYTSEWEEYQIPSAPSEAE